MFAVLESNQFDPSIDANLCFDDLGVQFAQKSCLCYSNHFKTILDEQIAGQSIGNNTKFNKFGFLLDWK